MRSRAVRLSVLVAAISALTAPAMAERGTSRLRAPLTRYSLVHGCYLVQVKSGPQLGPFTMQAASLGRYLLYGRRADYLGPSLTQVSTPDNSTIWQVNGSAGRGFKLTNAATGRTVPVTFSPAQGCAAYPEAQVGASGKVFTGAGPGAAVRGTVEGHAHVTAFEFLGGDWHCGRPWSPLGAPFALPDCTPNEQGANGAFQALLDYGGAPRPSDMRGWPTFRNWPTPTSLAEEGDYYTGIERAWKAGLRVMVTNLVDNEALCSAMTTRHNPCNDMEAVRIQDRDLHALQGYIDAQSGGPGKGWFRLVTDPFQARRVINAGKLAVIEGIEVSRLFGCGEVSGVPQCDRGQIDAGLKEVRGYGVRTFFPVHEFDNAFGGTKMIAGDTGVVVNAGNRLETGSFWRLEPCSADKQDAEQLTAPTGPVAQLLNGPMASLLQGNPLPVYPPGPQCNVRGMTDLGRYLIGQMIKQHFVIQTDHMDSKTADAAVAIAQQRRYAGLVSAHCCSSPQLFARIYNTGGFVNPPVGAAASFISQRQKDKMQRNRKYAFGFGWGSDLNGLGGQPGPDASAPVSYPFKSFLGDVTFTRERWGERTFDLNTDGLANYGMYADWLRQLQVLGGRSMLADMFNGAEAFLEMWERAYGVPGARCPAVHRLTSGGLGRLRLGASYASALRAAGQPSSRPGRSYRYCKAAGVFGPGGRLVLISTKAQRVRAGGLRVGASASSLRGRASMRAANLWVGPGMGGGRKFVYGVSSGHVRYVAVANALETSDLGRLRADLRAAGL